MTENIESRDYFLNELNGYENYAFRMARLWRTIYYVDRSALIVFAVLTSSDAFVALPSLATYKPLFGLMVAMITGFDVWLKPDLKFRGYYQANDEYDELEKKVRLTIKAEDKTGLRAAVSEYKAINKRLRGTLN